MRERNEKGFTLIEVVVVVAVIAILAAVLTPYITKYIDDSKIAKARNETQVVAAAVTNAYKVTGTPTVVLIGRNSRLVGRAVGSRDWAGEKGRALLKALLSNPAR